MEKKILARYPLGNPHRLWKQDNFILSEFSAIGKFFWTRDENRTPIVPPATLVDNDMKKVIKACVDVGFNLVEIGWATPQQAEDAVAYCEQYGLDLIYQNLAEFGGMGDRSCYGEKNRLEKCINDHRRWNCIKGYYVWDEPLYDEHIEETRMLMDICEREAPDKVPFTVAIPSYNAAYTYANGEYPAYLERVAEKIDPPFLSLDYYPIGEVSEHHDDETQIDDSNMWCDLALLKYTSAKHNMPMWFYYQGQDLHNTGRLTFSMVRSFMYAAALHGAKGLQHYESMKSIYDNNGDPYIFFEDQKAINKEFKNLGETLMALTCRRVIHDKTLVPKNHEITDKYCDKLESSAYLTEELPCRISVSEFDDEYGNGYMMVLNRDYAKAQTVKLPLNGDYRIYEVSKTDGEHYAKADSANAIELSLNAGDAVLIRLQKADEEAFSIEYKLSK